LRKRNRGKGPALRRAEAELRDADRASRSNTEQLNLLDLRPGSSAKERARLEKKKYSQKKD
jgi:hypothetical protein